MYMTGGIRKLSEVAENLDSDPCVEVRIYPFGSDNHSGSEISQEFVSEAQIDDWIRAFKSELDEIAEDAKRALRDGRARRTAR